MFKSLNIKQGSLIASMVLLVLVVAPLLALKVSAAQVQQRTLKLSDLTASATDVTYNWSFDVVTTGAIGSIELELCKNDPFPGTPCTAPNGLDMSTAILQQQFGETNFVIDPLSTANRIILSRPIASVVTPKNLNYIFTGITNPNFNNGPGDFYGRIRTFSSVDATGPSTDEGGLALMIEKPFGIHTEVPPYLIFCLAKSITGFDCSSAVNSYSEFGEFSQTAAKTAISQMVMATNADFGLNVTYRGTTMTSGNNIIQPLTSVQASTTGTSQFGMNLVANSNPSVGSDPVGPGAAVVTSQYNNPNRFKFVDGDTVVASSDVVNYRKFTTSYIVNISPSQSPGVYTTSVLYICLANF